MPYSSDIQIVNDANGTAYAFLADDGLLFACQWNAQAQRWDKGQVVPGSEGARGLQALVVDNLWPSSGSNGVVPGNAPGIVLAYRIGEGSSSQVVASFGSWGSDGSLSWTQAQPLSSQQGSDEAFALVPAADGTFQLVVQKREASATPQELLAQFSENPSELLAKQLDGLASGARQDSDLYVSDVQINSTGNGGYALQLSAPGLSPNSQTTALTPATATPTPATPAAAFGGNTQLSRAVLAANGVASPAMSLQSAALLTTAALRSGDEAPTATEPVTFTQAAAPSAGGSGFRFTNYIKNPASLASLALYPVRYSLGTALGEGQLGAMKPAHVDDSYRETIRSAESSLVEPEEPEENNVRLFDVDEELAYEDNGFGNLSFVNPEVDESFDSTLRMARFASDPLRSVARSSEVFELASDGAKIESLTQTAGLNSIAGIYAMPPARDFTLSGAYGGLLAGRGGYTVVNFSTFRYGRPPVDSLQSGRAASFRKANAIENNRQGYSDISLGQSYSPGWKFGQGLAGSFKTLFQYSNPRSPGGATTLIGFNAQQSLGWNGLAHTSRYFESGARFSLDLSLIAGYVQEQRYASTDGLFQPLADIGLAVGGLGDAISLFQTGFGAYALATGKGWAAPDVFTAQTNGLFINRGYEDPSILPRYLATAGGFASLGLAVGIPVGVGASRMNANGTYSFGLGLQENIRARLLSKYGVGLEVIAGSQQNLLWTLGEGGSPSLQALAFASVGAALPMGGFVPIIPNMTWNYEGNQANTGAAAPTDLGDAAGLAASSTPGVSKGSYIVAPTGAAYPMGYAPASATDALLALPNGPIASLLDRPTQVEWHQLQSFTASQLAPGLLEWARNNLFDGLNDGTYSNVPLVGLSLPGSAPATASFTASGGVISNLVVQGARSLSLPGWISDGVLTLQAAVDPALQNGDAITGEVITGLDLAGPLLINGLEAAYDATTQQVSYRLNQAVNLGDFTDLQTLAIASAQGQYLALPEPKSGRYVFGLDVFQAQNGNPAAPAVPTAGSVLDAMPLFSLQMALGGNGSPLSTADIQRIPPQLPISGLSQSGVYPKADGSLPAANDYSIYTYSNVPIALLNSDGSGTPITPLNPGVTATVKLSAGEILAITLDQQLYFNLPSEAYAGLPYTLVVDIEQALGNADLVNPELVVTPQQNGLNNFTDQDSFSANPSINNAGVFLSSGVSDQLPLLSSYGHFPVQNRVAYLDGNTVVYLNNTGGSSSNWQAVSASQLELETIYNEPENYQFTAASNPTAITDTASNTTYVFWVEASDPVIPLTGSDGEANYQAFMNALYGHQRINYSYATTSQAGTDTKWNYVNANDLYVPDDTLITDLRSFQVELDGVQRSLLVWTELPISALKTAEANPQELITTQLAVIKAGLINPNAASTPGGYTWDELFNDAYGNSTIATVPWSSDRGSGLSIADLSAATLQVQMDAVARFSGTINGTTLNVKQLSSGSLAVGDLILGSGVLPGTTVTAITKAATASSAGSYQVSTPHNIATTNLAAVPHSGEVASEAISFAGSFSGAGNTTLTLNSGAPALQVGDQLFGVGIEPGTLITAVLSLNSGTGAGSFQLNQGPASASGSATLLALPAGTPSPDTSQTLTTPVLSWSEAVRTPYNEAVLASAPLLFVPMAGLQAGINKLSLGTTLANNETFASSTGLNTAIAGALPKSNATAVENVEGLGVLATGLGTANSATLEVVRNTPQTPLDPAASPVAIFTGAINGTTLSITTTVSQGTLAVGELVVGEGIPAGTTIAALPSSPNSAQTGDYTLAYQQREDEDTTLAATKLRTLPESGGLPLASFSGSFSGSGGANGYTTLAITNLSGPLQVGDQVLGLGLAGGSTILEVASLDLNAGTAEVLLSKGPQTSGGNYGLAASPGGSSSPYTIEFWTQLDPDSNPAGAGLVALGQPSDTALSDRPVELPTGWLLSSSFGVEQLTWQDALNLSLETSLDGNEATDLYGWRWALVADGANTTAMDGTGGSNLYRNALLLNNLLVGDTIEGVESFLAAYGLSSSDLIGLDGTPANQIAAAPSTQFQFTSDFRPNAALDGASVPTTSLNGVAIDTSTALMNGGLVLAEQADANANLTDMFNALWDFEQTYGQAKVNFSLNPLTQPAPPAPSDSPNPPSANTIEQYGGYELQFVLQPGPAVSVNGSGQLVFDVAPGVSLVSADGVDYRDNNWNYVAASFLPEFNTYSASGTVIEVPRNVGTANLYVNGKLVATQANVINAYTASNFNDAAQLLSDNAGGAIDLLAIYGQALTTSQPPAFASDWPIPTSTDALALLKEAGFVVASKSPNPGQEPGAISNHYLAHTVDPNNAAKSTFTSALLPDANGNLSWSQAASLDPLAATRATNTSASANPLQDELLIPISASQWSQAGWYTNAAPTTAVAANPAGKTLTSITVTLTPSDGSAAVKRQLSPQEVLLGTSSLASLQPKAQEANLAYTFLSNTPALNLVISRQPSGTGDSNKLDATLTYAASVQLQFADGTSLENTSTGQTAGSVVPLGFSSSLADKSKSEAPKRTAALATAAVLEQAPLQLEYVDSGVVLSSQASPSDPSPASSFGDSTVYGSFLNSGTTTYSGWLAISQPNSSNAVSDPAGRVWINFAGEYTQTTNKKFGNTVSQQVSTTAQAPTTWLNALANSNFAPNQPNLPLLNSAQYQSSVGGLLIKADPSAGWGQNFGATMLVADVNNDGTDDLVIAAPQANSGGAVVIIDGTWISQNLTSPTGQTILDLSNPDNLGSYITVLRPGVADSSTDITTVAGFGSAIAFQPNSNALTPGTLWIGAPNYQRTLDSSNAQESTQPIGALYSYSTSSNPKSWGSANPTLLSNPLLGSSGTLTTPQAGNTTSTSWWGAQLGTAVAISSAGDLAVSAPGVVGAMVYTGTEATTDEYNNFNFNAKPELTSGLLYKLQIGGSVDSSQPYNSSAYTLLYGLQQLTATQTTFLTNFKSQLEQITQVAGATMQNNQAIQAAAIGSVMVFNSGSNLSSLGGKVVTASGVEGLNGRTYYGANPFNTLGDSGFGSSLSFADLTNTNLDQLIVGAAQSGGGGLVYMLDPSASYSDTSLGQSQYLATLAATNVITAAEAADYLGSGLVNLGDVNGDNVDDLLIQAYNAASSAGQGYVLFGSDQLSTSNANQGLIGLNPSSIGKIEFASDSFDLPILSELGSAGGLTGQGTYGPGDYNADGLNDIALGSGTNAKGYLTWGQNYLASISDLQLSRLTSDNGFLLDGLATTTQGSLRAIGDFNGDGYGDFLSINPGPFLTKVRIELGANTQEILADAPYSYYTFTVANGTQVLPAGDINGDGMADIALFLDQNLSSSADGNQGAGSTTGILYGRSSGELPLGSGFGFIAPVNPDSNAPLSPLPVLLLEGPDGEEGLTDATPAVIAVGTTLYAAVKGYGDNTLWFTRSLDGGNSWDSWSELTSVNSAFSTSTGPSLLNFGGKIYLSFVNSSGTLSLSSWEPGSTELSAWSAPVAISDATGTADFAGSSAPQLVDRGSSIGVLWVQGGSVFASTNATDPSDSNWSTPETLSRLVNGSGEAIAASSAPSYAWLGTSAVLAVNDGGVINVYGALGGSSNLQLASTFTAPIGGPEIASAPMLGTSDTGLVLTYTNSDGSISVNRLELLSPGGMPLPGVTFTADGGVDVSQAAINWQTTTLSASNSGISSALASTPVIVQGNLLLANVRNSSTPDNQIWLNAIPNASDPTSTTWLNSTVQLNDGQGGWSISQQGSDTLTSVTPTWSVVSNGQSPEPPAFAEANGVLYAAVRGTNNEIYWNYSNDGGIGWSSWQVAGANNGKNNAFSAFTTTVAPALSVVNDTLYLAYVGDGNSQINISHLPAPSSTAWSNQYQIPNQGAKTISMLNEAGSLVLYYQGTNDNIYRTSTTTPTSSTTWQENSIQYDNGTSTQTTSGQLVVTMLGNTTYLAYQGGTSSNPSNTTYLTSSDTQSNGSSWSLINDVPQADSASHSGVGLTTLNDTLVLSYADQVNSKPVVALQQGVINGGFWRGAPYGLLQSPGATASPQASLFVPGGSSKVLVASINASSSPAQDITTTFAAAQPLSQLLTSGQTGSTLSPVGDLNNDGFADLLVSTNNVAANFSSGRQLATGLRVISGAGSPQALAARNDPTAAEQAVQLAPALPVSSPASIAASISAPGSLSLTATSAAQRYGLTASISDLSSLLASSDSLSSAQQLFSGAFAPGSPGWSSTPTPPLSGNPALNTASTFGDLNGDGHNDFFDPDGSNGSIWIASAPEGPVFSLWSIRAAGDVNGNGVDDVLLALTPQGPSYPAQSDGKPSAIYSALIDGALFNVTDNTFNLSDLKAALNPYNSTELFDVTTMSTSDEYQSLQNWFSPIQKYQAPIEIESVQTLVTGNSAYTQFATNADYNNSPAPTLVHDASGNLYSITTQVIAGGNNTGILLSNFLLLGVGQNSLDPNAIQVTAIDLTKASPLTTGGQTLPADSIAPLTPGAAIHDGKLFVAIPSTTNSKGGYGTATNNIWIAYADLNNSNKPLSEPTSWTTYQVQSNGGASDEYSLLTPTLVSEGERLALYFPSGDEGNNDGNLNIHYLYSKDPTQQTGWGSSFASATNTYTGTSGTITIDASLSTTPSTGGWASPSGVIVTSPIAATTYQGRTVLAFRGYGDGTGDNVENGALLLAFAPTAQGAQANIATSSSTTGSSTTDWTLWDTGTTGINTPSIATDQANLYLTYTPWSTSATNAQFFPVALNIDQLAPNKQVTLNSDNLITAGTTHTLPITLQQAGVDNVRINGNNTNTGMTSPYYAGGYFKDADTQANNIGNAPQSVTPSFFGDALYVTNQIGESAAVAINYNQAGAAFGSNQTSEANLSLAGYSIDGNIDINGDGFKDMLVSDPSDPAESLNNQYALFGGDYLDIASQVGTNGNDVMEGTPLADVIYSLEGSDQVDSNGGADVIYTGAGDDAISIIDNGFIRVDAGSGFDVLSLEGKAGQSYDFRLDVATPEYFAGTKLRDIELISSQDYGANTLRFDAAAINAINSDRILFLTPDALDTIVLTTEFQRNSGFDTNFGGNLWSAYAAAPATATPASNNPALIYIATPTGQTSDWLDARVVIPTDVMPAVGSAALTSLSAAPAALPTTSAIASSQSFGDDLSLLAYRIDTASGVARFAIERRDASRRQVVAYASSATNSTALPGLHYSPATGLLQLDPGVSRQDIMVPINSQAFAALRDGSLSLQVEELKDIGQQSLHLLLAAASPSTPVLSRFMLTPDKIGERAILSFDADTNTSVDSLESLQLIVSKRRSADSSSIEMSQRLDISEFNSTTTPIPTTISDGALALDNDLRQNNQVRTRLELNFEANNGEASVSLLGPSYELQSNVEIVGTSQVSFLQDGPLTTWRSDSGSGRVSFGLQSVSPSQGIVNELLLSDAVGGIRGSINPTIALIGDWQSSEGLAVGSRSISTVTSLSGPSWTPTASRDGIDLELLELSLNGNQVTARFEGGVSAEFWQARGTAHTLEPVPASLTIQRLAGYNNAIGFYSLDSITGMVDGRSPGEAGYLQAALARSEAEDLLLSAAELPGFGQALTFNGLPLESQKSYGVLLLQNGSRETIFSSFSAANPGGETQMVRLGSDSNSFALGIEDVAVTSGGSDRDFNDNIVSISGVSLGIF